MAFKPFTEILQEAEDAFRDKFDRVVRPHLEPISAEVGMEGAAQLSTAISMKRIADFICGGKDHEGTDRMDVVAYIGREIDDVIKGR